MKKRMPVIIFAVILAIASGAGAAKLKVFEFADEGLRFSWSPAAKIKASDGTVDRILDGTNQSVKLKIIVRKGEKVPEAQHQYRLTSYFPGAWSKKLQECGGTGWTGCNFWKYDAESGKSRGLGLTGYGPSGTYIFAITAPNTKYDSLKPKMWALLDSIQLF